MTRARALLVLTSVACLAPLALARWSGAADTAGDSLSKQLSVLTEVMSLVRRTYVEETDSDTLLRGALDGATEALDPFATFVPADSVEPFLSAREVGDRLSGLRLARERGIVFVASIAPGSPADRAGIRVGDVVADIAGASTRAIPFWSAQTQLAGPAGSEVAIRILRRGLPLELTLRLETFPKTVPEARQIDGVWVLAIPSVDAAAVKMVRESLLAARDSNSLVIDLRGVAGDEGEQAYELASMFARGHLGDLMGRGESVHSYSFETEPLWSGHLAVLVNVATQGAGEILAATLSQAADATLVGSGTFGHAGRQRLVELSGGGRVLLTDAYYTGPDGVILDTSLRPDEPVLVIEPAEGEVAAEDAVLSRALELLSDKAQPTRRAA